MTTQPEALRLADELEDCRVPLPLERKAAAELRRLYAEIERLRDASVGYSQQTMDAVVREREKLREANAELLEALKELLALPDYDGTVETSTARREAKHKARAAIAKAEEVKP